jgi:iron complex outermembrane receptor protein
VFTDTNLTLGLRYTSDQQKFKGLTLGTPCTPTNIVFSNLATGSCPASGPAFVLTTSKPNYFADIATVSNPQNPEFSVSDSDRMTYRVVVDHHFTDNFMAYASWNTGFKSGYYGILSSPTTVSKPELLTAYEAGVKSDLFDGRLRLNAAYYHYNLSNLQTFYVVKGLAQTLNAGAAQIDGLEAEATASPLDNWNIHFGANWMPRATYTKYGPTPFSCPGPTLPFFYSSPFVSLPQNYNCSGSRMVDVPDWDINLGTDYTLPGSVLPSSLGTFDLAAQLHYTSSFPWDAKFGTVNYGVVGGFFGLKGVYSSQTMRESDDSIVNIQGLWTAPNQPITVTAWAKNLLGTKYLIDGTQLPGWGPQGDPGAPRTYGVTVGYSF